ncbi:MAG: signal peptide protein, partial [bacterium]
DGMAFSILGTAGTPLGYRGGVFAQPTNIGKYKRDRFAVIPEVAVSLGGRLTRWARAWIGYDFLYVDPVLRPGDQIDRVINPTRTGFLSTLAPAGVMGPLLPGFPERQTSFWAQGLTFGLELTY